MITYSNGTSKRDHLIHIKGDGSTIIFHRRAVRTNYTYIANSHCTSTIFLATYTHTILPRVPPYFLDPMFLFSLCDTTQQLMPEVIGR